jgi:hypothetical protein
VVLNPPANGGKKEERRRIKACRIPVIPTSISGFNHVSLHQIFYS